MGRKNGKLIPFLKLALKEKFYNNLEYEDDEEGIFYLSLPRAGSRVNIACERILQDWYKITGNKNYVNYSGGKTVFQAALNKCIYLITLPRNGTRKRFRFATPEEAKEKKQCQKRRLTASETSPPSVGSSGYQSGSDDCMPESLLELSYTPREQEATSETGYHSEGSDVSESSMELDTAVNQDSNTALNFDDIDLIMDKNSIILDKATVDDLMKDLNEIMKNDELNGEVIPNNNGQSMSVDHTLLGVSNMAPAKDETELEKFTVPFQQNVNLVKHIIWVCKKIIDIESVSLFIFESMIIENNDANMQEQIIIPNGMLEHGREYSLQKKFILLEKLFMFFI